MRCLSSVKGTRTKRRRESSFVVPFASAAAVCTYTYTTSAVSPVLRHHYPLRAHELCCCFTLKRVCVCDSRCRSSRKRHRSSQYRRTTRWPTNRSTTRTSTTTTSTNTGWSHCSGFNRFRRSRTATALQRTRIKIDIYYCRPSESCAGFTGAFPVRHAANSSVSRVT